MNSESGASNPGDREYPAATYDPNEPNYFPEGEHSHVNLTYLRHRAREGVPSNPSSMENFLAEVDKACDELEDYRRREGMIYEWVKKQSTYDADVAGLEEFLEGKADTPDTPV